MPGLTQRNSQFPVDNNADGFWSKHQDEISFNYLQKFWRELSPQARKDLLKLDKKNIFEQARKNMYCSRCNGLLLETFMQIVMFVKSSQEDGTLSNSGSVCHDDDDDQDPADLPWGGLTVAKDGTLTVLSNYVYSKSLMGLQNVFDSARARERERELLFPDACGGGGRGWISQGIPSYGRGHGTREACALHTARLSCDTLVDFWSALGEETRHTLLRMKEEDFIERLMYRFDSKRFCRDCRKNVIREFKELKELKRMRREPLCTDSFCCADSILQYEVSDDSIRVDWRQTFMDSAGTYHHFEWAVGTGEGKSDILDFENIGMNKFVNVDGLDLGGLSACYITLKAWKQDGRCTELSVKAHALKGQECVHSRLVVGDGFVSITTGESIRSFLEHAEEVEEEEEDDDVMDKDGNEMDAECSRPQKHAKSPELAREFLLDAATVIFKEQVEKAFREGAARQNAHSLFVCLVLKLMEERVHVACKEIITLEKQMKLLEEEEKEKFEEEERKERRRMKERERKQRRKERLKEKDGDGDGDKDKEVSYSNSVSVQDQDLKDEQLNVEYEENIIANDRKSHTGLTTGRPSSPDLQDQITVISSDCYSNSESRDHYQSLVADSGEITSVQDECDYTASEHSEYSFHGDKFWKDDASDSVSKCSDRQQSLHVSGNDQTFTKSESRIPNNKCEVYSKNAKSLSRQFRANGAKAQPRNCAMKHGNEKFHSLTSRVGEKYNSCSCTYIPDCRTNSVSKVGTAVSCSDDVGEIKSDSSVSKVKQFQYGYGAKHCKSDYMHDSSARSHTKSIYGNNHSRDQLHMRMVWEPMDSQKKYPRRNSESDIALISSSLNAEVSDSFKNQSESVTNFCDSNAVTRESETSNVKTSCVSGLNKDKENNDTFSWKTNPTCSGCLLEKKVDTSLNDTCDFAGRSDSNSKQACSNLCGENSNLASYSSQNLEMTTKDAEYASQLLENKEISSCQRIEISGCVEHGMGETPISKLTEAIKNDIPTSIPYEIGRFRHLANSPGKTTMNSEHVPSSFLGPETLVGLPAPSQSFPFPLFHQAPSAIGYYHPSTIIWPTAPANGLIATPQQNQYAVSNPLNYGWNGTPGFCMPHGGVSPMESPLLSQGQVPVYHPFSKATGMHPEEQVKISKPTTAQDVTFQVDNKTQLVPAFVRLEEARNGMTVPKPERTCNDKSNGFSLFHFGGPVALSSNLKEGKINELPLPSSVALDGEVDHIYSKKEANIEEYSLFAASNGFKFSF